MIRSFRDKDTEAIWPRRYVKKLSPELSRLAYNKLVLINVAESINDLRVPPGNRLEKLAGSRLTWLNLVFKSGCEFRPGQRGGRRVAGRRR